MLTIARTPVALRALADEWSDLHAAYQSQNPFSHPSWCSSWAQAFGQTEMRILVERNSTGALVGVLPLAPQGPANRVWSTLGKPLVDFGSPIAEPSADHAAAVLEWLLGCRTEWDLVELVGLPPDLAGELVSSAVRRGLQGRVTATETCPELSLSSVDQWRSTLLPKRLRRFNMNIDRLRNLFDAQCHELREPADLAAAIRRFESLRLQSWWHRGGFHQLPKEARVAAHGRLLLAFASRPTSTTYVSVAELVSGERLLSSVVLFWTNGTVLVALKATDTRLGASVSPGLALDLFVIELAAARGVACIAYGRGDEDYKFILGAEPKPTSDVMLTQAIRPIHQLKQLTRSIGAALP